MWNTLLFIFLGVAIVGGIVLFFFYAERNNREKDQMTDKISGLTLEKAALNERIIVLTSQRSSLESKYNAHVEAQRQLDEQKEKAFAEQKEQLLASTRAQTEQMERYAREQEERFAKIITEQKEQLKDAFRVLGAENSAHFSEQSAKRISELLQPLQEKFEALDQSMKTGQLNAAKQSASMETLIEKVMQQSQTVGDEARNLANALTGYSKVQGDFGEMLLTDVLKNSGLEEGVHFITQGVITDEHGHEIKSESGSTLIPDVMVLYPDDTIVIIDSKVSLKAYSNYMNAETVEDRKKFAREHLVSVRNHIDELKRKDYASYVPEGKTKVNYNILFIPMEGAFRLMLEEDPLLWQAAKSNDVLIVSQMTLSIVLNMIQMSWRQYNQEKNIAEVYKTAEELISQLKAWMGAYAEVGKFLDKARDSYDDSKKKLIDSNQSVVKKIGKLERLGLTPRRSVAKIKTGTRLQAGKESVIPAEFMETTNE